MRRAGRGCVRSGVWTTGPSWPAASHVFSVASATTSSSTRCPSWSDGVLLVLAGEGEQEEALRKRASAYGERVRFVSNVRGHVEAFLSACDLLIFAPSPTEGEPRVIVMAQLVGVPVIATDPEGALGLIVEGTGTIVSPSHDSGALAAVIDAYRADPERRRREGETARQRILESHDPERTLSAVERVLGDLTRASG